MSDGFDIDGDCRVMRLEAELAAADEALAACQAQAAGTIDTLTRERDEARRLLICAE